MKCDDCSYCNWNGFTKRPCLHGSVSIIPNCVCYPDEFFDYTMTSDYAMTAVPKTSSTHEKKKLYYYTCSMCGLITGDFIPPSRCGNAMCRTYDEPMTKFPAFDRESGPDPDQLSRRAGKTIQQIYDELFWKFVYTSTYEEADSAFKELEIYVSNHGMSLEPSPEGTWVHTPDPLLLEKVQNAIDKEKPVIRIFSLIGAPVYMIMLGAILQIIMSFILGVTY